MKRTMLLLATSSLVSRAFLAPTVPQRGQAPPHARPRSLITQVDQLAVAIDAPGPTALPKGKRIVRRKKRPQPASPVIVDRKDARVDLIKSKAEYDAILRENLNTLVVIKFFAPWCRSCKALDVKYRRMSVQYDDVKFVEVDVHQSPELKKQLGVRAVPTVKLHAGSLGQVASFTCGPKKAPHLERKIRLCKDVQGLAERLGKGGGMMEMVAGEMNGGKSVSTTRPSQHQPVESVAKGLMEKLERQELLAASLRRQLDELPVDDEL